MVLQIGGADALQRYMDVQSQARNCQSFARQIQTQLTGGTVDLLFLDGAVQAWAALLVAWNTLKADATMAPLVSNLQALVTGGTATSVGNDLTASITALTALVTAGANEFPKDAQGHLLDRVLSGGVVTGATAPTSQFPTLGTRITAWLATIA